MSDSDKEMKFYYHERAAVYDRVYKYPERQTDMRFLEATIPSYFDNKNVLEIAAGTGYWTQFIASKANSVFATDITSDALEQIKTRPNNEQIQAMSVDAYALDKLSGMFDSAFAGLWISHIPKQKLRGFVESLHLKLKSGSIVVFIDNSVSQCKRLPITHTDNNGNTYQDRELDSGSTHRILKNFPSKSELIASIDKIGTNHNFIALEHFWLFQYETV